MPVVLYSWLQPSPLQPILCCLTLAGLTIGCGALGRDANGAAAEVGQSTDCESIAQRIGEHRLAEHPGARRRTGPRSSPVTIAGRDEDGPNRIMHPSRAELMAAYVQAGLDTVAVQAPAASVADASAWEAAACGPVYGSLPSPGAEIVPGGTDVREAPVCHDLTMHHEVSCDGGRSWYAYATRSPVCMMLPPPPGGPPTPAGASTGS